MNSPLYSSPKELRTARLLLRMWRTSDRAPFAKLNANLRVTEFLPCALSRAKSDNTADKIDENFRRHGFGLWAVEIPGTTPFAGFIGLSVPRFEAHFTPCVEIGWRLDERHWGHGYATEGAEAVTKFAFDTLRLENLVSFTVPENTRSRRVMERLGMSHSAEDDFEHPQLPDGHRLRRHVLYRLHRDSLPRASLNTDP